MSRGPAGPARPGLARRALESDFVRRDLRAAVVPWVVGRLLVVGALGLARLSFREVGSGPRPAALAQGLFAWDAAFYREIAERGYGTTAGGSLRFFPLFPVAARTVGWVLPGNTAVAVLLLANVSALAFAALLHRLTERETGDADVAALATWLGAVFPAGAALVLGYAEATAMTLAVLTFLWMRSDRWWPAAGVAFLAGLARPVGVLLVVPLLVEATRGWGAAAPRERVARAVAVGAPAAGLGAYLLWVGVRFGDALRPIRYQNRATLRGGFQDPFSRVLDAARELLDDHRTGPAVHVAWAVLFLALTVVLARRLAASYAAYSGATVVLALCAHNLDSLERYAMGAFPLLIGIALVARRPDVQRTVVALSAAGLVGYATAGFLGAAVP